MGEQLLSKEVQELLEISCVFDQAVQRLSKPVTTVAKGVLKEHLILLENSMTCAGNLIGFNSGGYEALSHALSLRVLLMEATFFLRQENVLRRILKSVMLTLYQTLLHHALGINT